MIVALNDRDRTLADWRERRGVDWVDQMLLGGMLTCAVLEADRLGFIQR